MTTDTNGTLTATVSYWCLICHRSTSLPCVLHFQPAPSFRAPWICSRCGVSNAPHIDRCSCSPGYPLTHPVTSPWWPYSPTVTNIVSGLPASANMALTSTAGAID